MVNYVYTKTGTPVALHDDKHMYDLCGQAVAKLRGSKVYCMSGHYVGELIDGVILLDEGSHRHAHPRTRGYQRKGQRPVQSSVA